MAKPGKKKDKPQKDEKQTKISSFFENKPDKKGESKLFTTVSHVSVKGAGRLTSVKERHRELGTGSRSISKPRAAASLQGQQSRTKQTKGVDDDDDDDVVFVDAEDPVPCGNVPTKDSNKIILHGGDLSDREGKFCGRLKTSEENGILGNINNESYKHREEQNLDSFPIKYGSDSLYQKKGGQSKQHTDAYSFNNEVHIVEPAQESPVETSEASFTTPTKQAVQANCEGSESSPDIICETPDVDRVLGAAALLRRKNQSNRSFLCPGSLLGVQPGLKPAHLRMKQLKGASKLAGKVSISFTASSESLSKTEDKILEKQSAGNLGNDSMDVDICSYNHNGTVKHDTAGPVSCTDRQQMGLSTHVRPFQASLEKNINTAKDGIALKENPEVPHPDMFCIPETQYFDIVSNLGPSSIIEDDFEVEQAVVDCQRNIQPAFQPSDKHWSPRHKEAIEQYIKDIDSASCNDPFRPNGVIHSESNLAKLNTLTEAGFAVDVNMRDSKTSSFLRTTSNGASKSLFEVTKKRSKLINALEAADSKAEITEENLWMGERLMKHFSEDDFIQSMEGKLQDLQTTPVKVYAEQKHVKRQAKPGLSPCSKRHLKNSFTDLKDPTQTYVSSLFTKTQCLENLACAIPDINPTRGRLTENRAYQFGLKKKGNLKNKKVTLENDKLLSELLGQLKSPSKAESKATSHTLKELNPFPKLAVDKERSNIGIFSDNSRLLKNSSVRPADDVKSVLQSDIEILHQLFGKDASDSEETEKENSAMVLDNEHPVLQQGFHKDAKASYTLPSNVATSCNSAQEDAIVILDDTQSMNMDTSECFIVEDNSDNSLGSPSKTTESHSASESHEITELDNVCESHTIPKSHESYNASHNVTETTRDLNQTSETLPVIAVCNNKETPNAMVTVSSNLHSTVSDSSAHISSNVNLMSTDTGPTSVPKVTDEYDTCPVVINDPNIMISTSDSKQLISIRGCIDNKRQTSEVSPDSVVTNTETDWDDTVTCGSNSTATATDLYSNSGAKVSSGLASEAFISAKDVSNMGFGNTSSRHIEDKISVVTIRNCVTDGDHDMQATTVVDNTEFSTSVCDMLSETFDEDFPDFDMPDIANEDFKFTNLWNRFTVLDVVHDTTGDEVHLTLACCRSRTVSHCTLRGFWADTVVCKGDTVNIVGASGPDACIVDDINGLIIVNPDLLLSGTLVVSSIFCARKSVLNEKFKGVDSGNLQMLYGSVIHSLFQSVLKEGARDEKAILKMASVLLRSNKFLHEMYSQGVQDGSVMEEIVQYIPSLISWLTRHTPAPGKGGKAKLPEADVVIQEIHDIEENIWSPRFGLKGKIDVTVKARLRKPNQVDEVKVVPLELKTGKASFSNEHNGQVMLYSMMSSDRREDPEEGILLYLKHGQMERVPVKPQIKSGLIQMRNNLAHYLTQSVQRESSATGQLTYQLGQLPKPINNQNACSKCAHLLNCSIYQRAVDQVVHQEKHSMNKLVPEALQHLTETDLSYFTHWMLCLDIEEQESQKKHLSQIWRASSLEREKNGECLRNLMIAGSELDIPESQCFNEGRGCSLRFCRDPSQPATPLNAVGVVINDMVVISSEDGRYIALATGFVWRISQHVVEVIVDRDYLHDTSPFDNLRFRLDKNESFSTSGYLCTNLSRLMESNLRASYLRDVIIKLRPPEFELQFSKTNFQKVTGVMKPLNKQQRRAILKVLMSKDYVLIKGFPGTGKTATIVALVKILHLLGQSVLLTSYTHSAVDNILLKLKESGVPFLRLGRRGRIHPLILPHCAEVLTSSTTFNSVLELKKFYDSYNVVATSALGVTHPIFKQRQFDVCIVDEASQVLQPACLGPLFHCRKFVLVGDPKQLSPVVQSREARDLGMDESLFARLDNTGATYDLCLQYRMNR